MMKISNGLLAGFVATASLTILMVAKSAMGIMPELNVINMLADMMHSSITIGWFAHFVIGTVIWGVSFAYLVDKLPGGIMSSAILFSIGAWIVMMIGTMPLAGAGIFGHRIGIMAPVATLMLHIIWGAILGLTYARLTHNHDTSQQPAH